MTAPYYEADGITKAQARLRPVPANPRTAGEYRRVARWWELEARRGYPSANSALLYALNMRWAAECANLHGPGTWIQLRGWIA